MRSARWASRLVTAASFALPFHGFEQTAHAGSQEQDDEPPPSDPAFRYTTRARPNVLRAIAEQFGVLLFGFAEYLMQSDQNARDWDLSYSWQDFRSKLLLQSASFDNNRFDTNWVTHPLAGYFYYTAARGNRIGILGSFGMAFASSTFWEYVGEFREQVSLNDVVTTPISAVAFGEAATQLGAFFQRSRPSRTAKALGWVLVPFKSAHDAIDGLEVERPHGYDELGFPDDVWHRFRVGASGGVTSQERGLTQAEGRFRFDSRIVTLPDYGRSGRHDRWFDAGEVSWLALGGALSDGTVVDVDVAAGTLAAGHYHRDVRRVETGLLGHGSVVGLSVGSEYGRHDYDRDRRRSEDQIALVSTGAVVEESAHAGPLLVRARGDVLASFGGVSAYALYDYVARAEPMRLSSVVRGQGYYHAYGATLRPSLEIESGRFDAGGDVRLDWFAAITGLDRRQFEVIEELQPVDRRARVRAWLGVRPCKNWRWFLTAERRERAGRIGSIGVSRSEVSLQTGIDFVF